MLSCPGVAMKPTTGPSPTSSAIRRPSACPGRIEVLADIGEPVVALGVGVVGEHRNPGVERPLCGLVEGMQVHQRDRDGVRFRGDRGVHALTISDATDVCDPVH